MKFYSEYGEDQWIANAGLLAGMGPGHFYVDLGCAHPTQFSNTAWLRDRGWSGLGVDANDEYAEAWMFEGRQRGAVTTQFLPAVVAGAAAASRQFFRHPNTPCARMIGNHGNDEAGSCSSCGIGSRIPTGRCDHCNVPLDWVPAEWRHLIEERPVMGVRDLLAPYGRVDYLSVDLEGAEFEVLEAWDWERLWPRVIVAEKDFRGLEFLLTHGYRAVHLTAANIIYERQNA